MIALLVVTDGRRDCIQATIHSLRARLHGPVTTRLIYDDSGDESHRAWLAREFPEFTVIHAGPRQGFGGAIRAAWAHLRTCEEPFIAHWEDDFVLNDHLYLEGMCGLLDRYRHLVQVALLRQPWSVAEVAAGGIMQLDPGSYSERADEHFTWTQHRKFFTTNPCVYRHDLIDRFDWPTGDESEGHFGIRVFGSDPELHSAFLGKRFAPPLVHHIGDVRAGVGY